MNDKLSDLYSCIDTRVRYDVYKIMKNIQIGGNKSYLLYGMNILLILMIINILCKMYSKSYSYKYICVFNKENELKCNRF